MFVPKGMEKHISQSHYARWLRETEAGQKEIAKKMDKAKKQIENKEKSDWNKKKQELLPVVHEKKYKGLLQNEINKLSRMIDAKFGYTLCIDCGKPFGNQIDAAHFTSVGSNNSIRYNLHNLHSAKSDCNQYSDKHKQGYTIGLKERYGESYLTLVEELPVRYKYIKVSAVEVYEKLKIVRSLVKNFDTFKSENGIAMRESFNNIIGIYGDNN
jgi:RNA polymerase-binding transcription factor DksA